MGRGRGRPNHPAPDPAHGPGRLGQRSDGPGARAPAAPAQRRRGGGQGRRLRPGRPCAALAGSHPLPRGRGHAPAAHLARCHGGHAAGLGHHRRDRQPYRAHGLRLPRVRYAHGHQPARCHQPAGRGRGRHRGRHRRPRLQGRDPRAAGPAPAAPPSRRGHPGPDPAAPHRQLHHAPAPGGPAFRALQPGQLHLAARCHALRP